MDSSTTLGEMKLTSNPEVGRTFTFNQKSCNQANDSENKNIVARKLLSVIREGDFDELLIILSTKPDLNVFINGQTALHYCLLFGEY
jgi:hypothetical protein